MQIVTMDEAESRFDELLDLAEAGEEVVIFRNGHEVARLRPPRHYEDVPVPTRGFGQ